MTIGSLNGPPLRSLDEILREADATDDLDVLSALWRELVTTRYQRPIIDLEFAREHMTTLARAMGARHAAEIRALVEPGFNAMGIFFKGGSAMS